MIEGAGLYEMLVPIFETTGHHMPEDSSHPFSNLVNTAEINAFELIGTYKSHTQFITVKTVSLVQNN
jgi:hypothetical protein